MNANDCRLVAGSAEWLFGEALQEVRSKPADQRSSLLRPYLAVKGRADGRDVVVDRMLWRTAGKSARYAVELVATVTLDAVR